MIGGDRRTIGVTSCTASTLKSCSAATTRSALSTAQSSWSTKHRSMSTLCLIPCLPWLSPVSLEATMQNVVISYRSCVCVCVCVSLRVLLFATQLSGVCRDGGQEGAGPGHGGGPHLPQHRGVPDAGAGGRGARAHTLRHHHHPAAPGAPLLHRQHPVWHASRSAPVKRLTNHRSALIMTLLAPNDVCCHANKPRHRWEATIVPVCTRRAQNLLLDILSFYPPEQKNLLAKQLF